MAVLKENRKIYKLIIHQYNYMAIQGTIRKWGNSAGLRLSKNDLDNLNINENDEVIVEIKRKENPVWGI